MRLEWNGLYALHYFISIKLNSNTHYLSYLCVDLFCISVVAAPTTYRVFFFSHTANFGAGRLGRGVKKVQFG